MTIKSSPFAKWRSFFLNETIVLSVCFKKLQIATVVWLSFVNISTKWNFFGIDFDAVVVYDNSTLMRCEIQKSFNKNIALNALG